jgi:hypothetical protein
MTKKLNSRAIRFAICVIDSEPDLEVRKIYKVLPDKRAAQDNYVRVVDESGEDYLYPANYFVFIEVPVAKERALLLAA